MYLNWHVFDVLLLKFNKTKLIKDKYTRSTNDKITISTM